MAIKIIRAEEPIAVEQLVVVLYGSPGLGKSTLGFSANNPLLIDFDKGAYRAAIRGDSVAVDSWTDVTDITAEDLEPYNTVVVDTAGRALDFLTMDIIRRHPKKGYGGALTLQGYGLLKSEFTAWLKSLRTIGKDVILIAHSSEDKNGDDLIERLDVQGGSKGEIYKSADAMGRLSLKNNKRVLNFSPTEAAFGKNPGSLPPLDVPEIASTGSFMAGVISDIKEKLNALTEEQAKRQSIIADWIASFEEAKKPDDFAQLSENIKNADASILPTLRGAFKKRMDEAGIVYNKNTQTFEVVK